MDRLNKGLSSIGTKDGGITVGSTAYAGHAERMQADSWWNIIFGGRRPFSIHFSLFRPLCYVVGPYGYDDGRHCYARHLDS